MRCRYFRDGEISQCTAFPNSFRPGSDITNDYCNNRRHKNCPFYVKAEFYSSILRIDTAFKQISIRV